jgi:hypothetical protein
MPRAIARREQPELAPFQQATLFDFRITPTGLVADINGAVPSYEQWRQLGSFLRFMEGSIAWLIGDWVAFGEAHYEERMSQALDATEWEPKTVQQYAWVADRVPRANRDADLSFSHHREVADLRPREQKVWLQRAKAEGWNVQTLRRNLNTEKHPDVEPIFWLVIGCKTETERDALQKQWERKGRQVRVP